MAYPTITFGSYAATNSSNQIVFTKPVNTLAGDTLLIFTYTRTTYTATPPSGWTLIGAATQSGANPETKAFYRVCDGTEGASFTFSATSFQTGGGMISLVKGADPVNPLDVYGQNALQSVASSSSPPSLTTQSAQALIVYAVHAYVAGITTLTPPNDVSVLSNAVYGSYARALASANGPASPGAVTPSAWSSNAGAFWSNMSVALKPAQAANNPPTASMTASTLNPSIGDTVTFNSNAVDPEGGTLSFAWSLLTSPAASGTTLVPNGLTATLAIDAVGSYSVRCIVTDDHNQSVSVSTTVVAKVRVRTKLASGTAWTNGVRRQAQATSWQNGENYTPSVVLIGKGATASSYASTLTPTLPTGVQAGDVLYAVASSNGVTVSAPAGWTSLKTQTSSSTRCYVWRKVASNGETASTFSMTGSNGWGIAVYVYRGVNATTPEAVIAVGGGSGSRETTLGLLTVPTNGCAGLYVAGQTGTTSNSLQAFNVAKTDYSYYTDGNGRFVAGSETNLPAGTIGRSIFCEKLGNMATIGIIIQP